MLHVLAMVNNAAMNIREHYLLELRFSPGICSAVGLPGPMVILFLVF